MVQDARVSQQLSRLGGVYTDPSRVDRDASSLLKSNLGEALRPIAAELVEDNGEVSTVLVLQGTIATHFRGNTYQLLVDIYLPAGYPNRPPTCFVRLAENMYLKENHRHVGSDGKVYLPYLHEWRQHSHNLVELVVAMSSVFSDDPPVFARAAAAPAPPPPPPPPPPPAQDPTPVSNGWFTSQHILQQQEQKKQAKLESEKLAEKERQEQIQAQQVWESKREDQVRGMVARKIEKYLKEESARVQSQVERDMQDQQRLQLADEQKIQVQLTLFEEKIEALKKHCATVQKKETDIAAWLEEAKERAEVVHKPTVDDMVVPANALHAQMLDLCAENASISDAMYFLDRALYLGHLDLETHMRQVRRLAKKQFLVRAHLVKIQQAVLRHPPSY